MTTKFIRREDITDTNEENGKEYTLRSYVWIEQDDRFHDGREVYHCRGGREWYIYESDKPLFDGEYDKKIVEDMIESLRLAIVEQPPEDIEKVLFSEGLETYQHSFSYAVIKKD